MASVSHHLLMTFAHTFTSRSRNVDLGYCINWEDNLSWIKIPQFIVYMRPCRYNLNFTLKSWAESLHCMNKKQTSKCTHTHTHTHALTQAFQSSKNSVHMHLFTLLHASIFCICWIVFGGKEDFKHLDFLETCKVWKVWKVNRLCKMYSRPTLDIGVAYGAKYQMQLVLT